MSVTSWRVLSQTSQANRLRVGPLVTPVWGSLPLKLVAVLAALGRTAAQPVKGNLPTRPAGVQRMQGRRMVHLARESLHSRLVVSVAVAKAAAL